MRSLMPSLAVGDPDLVIRTGGERRISNFLLFGLAYAELYFEDALWPDFGSAELHRAVASYQARERRFGLVGQGAFPEPPASDSASIGGPLAAAAPPAPLSGPSLLAV